MPYNILPPQALTFSKSLRPHAERDAGLVSNNITLTRASDPACSQGLQASVPVQCIMARRVLCLFVAVMPGSRHHIKPA